MIVFSNHPLTKKILDGLKGKKLILVCDDSAKELIEYANRKKIETCNWTKFKSEPFWDDEWGIVFSFGHIIPKGIIELFCRKIINIHPSLLPKFRGSSPLQSSILAGEKIGYSIIHLNEKLDEGDILFQKEMPSGNEKNYSEILDEIIIDATENIEKALEAQPKKQEHECATYCEKISHQDLEINAKDTPQSAFAKIRCYFPYEKAYMVLSGKKFFIHKAQVKADRLEVLLIQPEGKRIMSAKDFLNGYSKLLTIAPSFVKIS